MKNAYADSEEPSNPKRARFNSSFQQEWNPNAYTVCSHNPMDEQRLGPLGLKLRKSPSLKELIDRSLGHKHRETLEDVKSSAWDMAKNITFEEKKKASNFSALALRIGAWEYVSRFEGDLVAKCYFSKRKLVWEVLEGGLKSKLEIQWGDISGLNATCPQNGPGTLEIELSRPPMFFKESDPQPRKHTIWQATSDFTSGQATLYKRHLLQFAKGQLERHYQNLIQSDARLNMLSKKGLANRDSPLFDTGFSDQCSLYLRLLQQNISPVKPHSAYMNSGSYLPPLTCSSEAEQSNISDVGQVENEESFSGFSVSTSEEKNSWSSRRNTKLDELARYLLDDSIL
ncbi:hypothetical protein SUGI_1143130 [Cryptomeria japonica]|uniref:uncharacterized protein LOC131063936 n=1 Tax=Cryptomeria japonica TaxID=3369 RepID=UPI002414C699|nr:uncharacterized protein LOC131063936 [Cryptomeria japonica]GLJ53584.1 hypothetical protein SUGI_1143130 [Cryptomeria japonica]